MLTQHDIEEIGRLIEEKSDERIRYIPTKEEFFSRMDKLSGEIKTMREEFPLHAGSHDELSERDEKLDQRLKTVEQRLNIKLTSA